MSVPDQTQIKHNAWMKRCGCYLARLNHLCTFTMFSILKLSAPATAFPARSIVIGSAQHVHGVSLAFSLGGPAAAVVIFVGALFFRNQRRCQTSLHVEGSRVDPFSRSPFLTLVNCTAAMKAALVHGGVRMEIEKKKGIAFDRFQCISSCCTVWQCRILDLRVFKLQVEVKQKSFKFATMKKSIKFRNLILIYDPTHATIHHKGGHLKITWFSMDGVDHLGLGENSLAPLNYSWEVHHNGCSSITTIHHTGSLVIIVISWCMTSSVTQYLQILSVLWKRGNGRKKMRAMGWLFNDQNLHVAVFFA